MKNTLELWSDKNYDYFAIRFENGRKFIYESGLYIVPSEVYVKKIGSVKDEIPKLTSQNAENVLGFICHEMVLHFTHLELIPREMTN